MFAHRGTFCAFIFPRDKEHFCNHNLFYKWVSSQCCSTPLSFVQFCPPSVLWGFFLPVLIRIGIISVNKRKKVSLGGKKMKEQLLIRRLGDPLGGVLDSQPQLRASRRGRVFVAVWNQLLLMEPGGWSVSIPSSQCQG